ncbi:MAG: apolipoprotein N-acyltransferase [Geobacteraceae bacterium]|nr:apolipoprotein N-acyltransferase [Geobacteraceae bacterium]
MSIFQRILPLKPWVNASLTGILLALSFPKLGLSILAWGAFLPLFYAVRHQSVKMSFKFGFLAGFVAYAAVFYWLNIVMTTYGKLPLPVSLSLTLLMAAYLALYPAAAISLSRLAELRSIPLIFSFPFIWVALEYLRAYLFSGLPWASLGYSQFRTLPLIQIADITGVYGVSFLVLTVNIFLFQLWRWIRGKDGATYPILATVVAVPLFLLTIFYGFISLNKGEHGKEIKVALAQGNIPQDVKWDPAFQEETVAIYERLSRRSKGTGADLVVWPESSLPFFFQKELLYSDRVSALARELNSYLVVSSPALDFVDGKERLLNSAFLISTDGSSVGRSDKMHLVPFGEYVPLARLLPFVKKMVQGIGDFSPGRSALPLSAPFGKMGVLICFEGIFPEISRDYVRNGATLLVNITNDAWFGDSSAPYQHLSMTVFRAVENRVPLVRSANTGITAFIDSRGHVQAMTILFKEALLSGKVKLGTTRSLYTVYGDIFAWSCSLFAIILMGRVLFKR